MQLPLRQRVIECVRAQGAMSRIEVAKVLGVSPASMTAVVGELLEDGLLLETAALPTERATRGRPPVALRIAPGAIRVAGIKISDKENTATLIDFSGEVLVEARLPREKPQVSLDALMDEAAQLLDILRSEVGNSGPPVSAVALGMPGAIDHVQGHLFWSPLLHERDVDFCQRASERLDLPVEIDNDANLVTLAELWFGEGRGYSDFAVVSIEHGVGMGIVMNNQIYRGAHGLGLELGHTKVQRNGALCRCGQRGCLEAYVADYALVREALVGLNLRGEDSLSVDAVLARLSERADAGDPAALTIFRRAGEFLAVGLANVINLFDPARILLSGPRMGYDHVNNEELLAEVASLTLSQDQIEREIGVHAWGDHVWARGAAALALSSVTERVCAQRGEPDA